MDKLSFTYTTGFEADSYYEPANTEVINLEFGYHNSINLDEVVSACERFISVVMGYPVRLEQK